MLFLQCILILNKVQTPKIFISILPRHLNVTLRFVGRWNWILRVPGDISGHFLSINNIDCKIRLFDFLTRYKHLSLNLILKLNYTLYKCFFYQKFTRKKRILSTELWKSDNVRPRRGLRIFMIENIDKMIQLWNQLCKILVQHS